MKIGATGTPTFVIGKSTPDGVDGELMVGALPYQMFDTKLKELQKYFGFTVEHVVTAARKQVALTKAPGDGALAGAGR